MSSTHRETNMPPINNNAAPATSAALREALAACKLALDEAKRRHAESLPKDQRDYQTPEQKRACIANREEVEALTSDVQRLEYELSRAEFLDQDGARKQEAPAAIEAAGKAQAQHRKAAEAFEARADKIEKQIQALESATQEASMKLDEQEAAAHAAYAKAVSSGDSAALDSASQDIRRTQEARTSLTQTDRLNESLIGALRKEGKVCAEQRQAARDAENQARLERYQALLAILGDEFDRAVDALEAAAANYAAAFREAGARHDAFSDLRVCRIGKRGEILTGRSVAARAAAVNVSSLTP